MASEYLPLLADYRNLFADSFADLEEMGLSKADGQFSYPEIHGEIRMAFSHFSRHVLGRVGKGELDAARKHVQRAQMDTYKCLYVENRQLINKDLQRYEAFSIEEVDGGDFFTKLCADQEKSRNAFEAGKHAEAQGLHRTAASYYKSANGALDSEREYVNNQMNAMGRARRLYFVRLKRQAIPIALAIGTALLFFLGW